MHAAHCLATFVITAASLLPWVGAHSWLECTDYRVTPGSDATKIWDKALCLGHARCGKRQATEGFGVDTGFNYHSGQGCQCVRGSDNYDGISKAVYTPGQRVCLAYPSKNHVAAPCTNANIPDAGVKITRSARSSTSDDDVSRAYTQANGAHVDGTMDYKGFQNCPNFCSNMDKSLCTMCFDLEPDLAPGEYTFRWVWSFNSNDDAYSSCWEAEVKASGAYGNDDAIPIAGRVHAASDAPTTSPVMATATPTPTPTQPSTSQPPAPTRSEHHEEAAYMAEHELDCDEDEPAEKEEGEEEEEDADCSHSLPSPQDESAVVAPAFAPPPSSEAPAPSQHADCEAAGDDARAV